MMDPNDTELNMGQYHYKNIAAIRYDNIVDWNILEIYLSYIFMQQIANNFIYYYIKFEVNKAFVSCAANFWKFLFNIKL